MVNYNKLPKRFQYNLKNLKFELSKPSISSQIYDFVFTIKFKVSSHCKLRLHLTGYLHPISALTGQRVHNSDQPWTNGI